MSSEQEWFHGLVQGMSELESRGEPAQRYLPGEKLGEGATAIVYRAWDRELRRTVAIKELKRGGELPAVLRERFAREARVMARLSHPNVLAVYDVVETPESCRLVLEFVDGVPLSRILEERTRELPDLLAIVEQAARGVAAAHAQGIVHRDLKPANILVPRSGEPKVGDFGLARMEGGSADLTRTGALLGTPLYMAPEQVQGAAGVASPATDVYALGTILYECATGRPPYAAGSLTELFRRILQEEPAPIRRLASGIAADLDTIVAKAMEKDPSRRYADAAAFADDLGRFRRGEPILARPPTILNRAGRWVRRHRTKTAAAAAVGVCLIAAGALLLGREIGLRRETARLVAEAGAAERRGEYDQARAWLGQAQALGRRDLRSEIERVSRAEAAAARRHAAEADLHRARAESSAAVEGEKDLARLKSERGRLLRTVTHADPIEKRLPLLELERRIEESERDIRSHRAAQLAALQGAEGADPGNAAARAALAEFYFGEFERAERTHDPAQMSLYETLVRHYDDGSYADRLRPTGSVRLDSVPSGAEAFLFRYEEGPDRRLMPRPYSPEQNRTKSPEQEATPETAYALECSIWNRWGTCPVDKMQLRTGSYLVVLRSPGKRDARYPLLVRRGRSHENRIRMYTDEEIGRRFAYVPAGPFVYGGDSRAYASEEADEESVTGDFFISETEITERDYVKFIDSLVRSRGVEEAQKRVPLEWEKDQYIMVIPPDTKSVEPNPDLDPRLPVANISWDHANEFCLWLTSAARARGEKALYRLPTAREWEKAARGADGRPYPWGHHFDWSFANTGDYYRGDFRVRLAPADESPYGVRDLAGNCSEFTADSAAEDPGWKISCGADRLVRDSARFRSASRHVGSSDLTFKGSSIRVVKVIEP